jgi:hypothetical protein
MKRLIGALLLTVGLLVVPLHPVDAAPSGDRDPVKGGACADITADGQYADRFPTNAPDQQFAPTVFGTIDTAKASCSGITYSLSVYATGPSPARLGYDSETGDGSSSHFDLSAEVTGAPATVCIVFASSNGDRTLDPAPNTPDGQCTIGTQRVLNGGTGASGMR